MKVSRIIARSQKHKSISVVLKKVKMRDAKKLACLFFLCADLCMPYFPANSEVATPAPVPRPAEVPAPPTWPIVNLNLLLLGSSKHPFIAGNGVQFQLVEDGDVQTVQNISGPGSPVSLCVEIQGGAWFPEQIHDAIISLIKQLPPQSEVTIVIVADKAYLALPFASASAAVEQFHGAGRLNRMTRESYLASLGSTEEYLRQHAHYPRRALVIMTGWAPNRDSDIDDAVRSMLVPGAPFVYLIRLRVENALPFDPEDQLIDNFYAKFARSVGGLSLTLSPGEGRFDYGSSISELRRDIDSQYALTYVSTHKIADTKFHKVDAKISQNDPGDSHKRPQINIQVAPGYYVVPR